MNAAALFLTLVCGHELPDGVVSCGLQLVVREERIELRYQVGVSPDTAREILGNWGVTVDRSEQVFPIFRQALLEHCLSGLTIEMDGKIQGGLRAASVKEVRRAHARVECLYELENPARDGRRHYLVVRDDNFASYPGAREVAVKSRDGYRVQTTAPAVLGRAAASADAHDKDDEGVQHGFRQVRLWINANEGRTTALWPWLLPVAVGIVAGRWFAHVGRRSG